MCQNCVKKAKNLGAPKTVKPGLIRVLAHYQTVPLFWEFAANYAVEAEVYRLQRKRTNRKPYRRHGRRKSH